MKVAWSKCQYFVAVAQQAFLPRLANRETKLSYAVSRVLGRIEKEQPKVSECIADIEIDHCVTEKRGDFDVIVRDSNEKPQFTKEGLKQRIAATRKWLDGDNVEIEPYIATQLPDDLTVLEIEAFAGFVINEADVERLLAACEARCDKVAEPESDHQTQAASA